MLIHKLTNLLASTPVIFHYLRKIPEFNYIATKQRVKEWVKNIDGLLLDLGCGTGEFSGLCASEGYIGLDINRPYLRFANKLTEKTFLNGSGSFLPFKESSFNGVLINGVIHHLSDSEAEKIFSEVWRITKPEGSVLLIEDVPGSKSAIGTSFIHWLDEGDYIRPPVEYEKLFERFFKIKNSESFKSGFCTYAKWILERK